MKIADAQCPTTCASAIQVKWAKDMKHGRSRYSNRPPSDNVTELVNNSLNLDSEIPEHFQLSMDDKFIN